MKLLALGLGAVIGLIAHAPADPLRQSVDDPAVRAAVERFFAVQEAEDTDGYLALWSSTAPRMQQLAQLRMQLKFIFESGDDKFSNIVIDRVIPMGDRLRVRVSAVRARSSTRPDGSTATFNTSLQTSLTFVREGTALKLVSEGAPTDDLAEALIAAPTPEAREALLAIEPDLVTERLVQSLSRRADVAAQSNQYSLAQTIYQRVLDIARRIGDKKGEGQALQNIANAKYFLRDFTGALDAYTQRLTLERDAANDEGIVGALLGIATIKYSSYEYAAALASYEEALRLQEKLHDEYGLAVSLLSTGNVRYLQGDLEGAIADYQRCRDVERRLGNTAGAAKALEGLARTSTAQGDFAAALEAYAGVLQEARSRGDRSTEGHAIQSVGEIHLRLGNLDTARKQFDESRAHFEAVNDQASVGRVWQAAALTDLMAARFAPAEQEYGKSSAACTIAKDAACVARAIVGLGFAQASQSHFDDAIATYGKAIAAFKGLNRREEAARAELGLSQALLGKKEYTAALVSAGRARLEAVAINEDDVLWRAAVAEGRAARRLNTADRALAAAKDAVAAVQRLSRDALDRPGQPVAQDAVEAYAFLAILQAESGDAAGVFDTMEQRRALALRISLARNEREIAKGMTAAEREAERASAASLASLYLQLDHEQSLPKPDAARVARFQQAIGEAAKTRQQDQQRLFERHPDLASWRGLAPAAALPDLSPWLAASGALVVQFAIDDDDLLVATARGVEDKIELHAYVAPVARQTLAERIAKTVEPANLMDVEAWRKASMELVTVIPADAFAQMTAASRAIVLPDGVLWRVPFEALPVSAGSWADRTTVTYAISLASVSRPARRTEAAAPGPVVAIASPDLAAGLRARISETAPGWSVRTPENADAEIARTTSALGEPAPVVLSGTGATESAFRRAAPDASVLHVAAPFRMNSASPLFSLMLLAGEPVATPPPDPATVGATATPAAPAMPAAAPAPAETATPDAAADGLLEAREIMNLALRARVAVLSDGAAASMRDAASVTPTVQWAWRVAGVGSLVMPRWAGEPSAGAEWLAAFHESLKGGASPDAALQAARTAVRAREGMHAPYHWAGWIFVE